MTQVLRPIFRYSRIIGWRTCQVRMHSSIQASSDQHNARREIPTLCPTCGRRHGCTCGDANVSTEDKRSKHSARPTIATLCPSCGRRFGCTCGVVEEKVEALTEEELLKQRPEQPGQGECCESAPQCEHCVWLTYQADLDKFEQRLHWIRSATSRARGIIS
eukprot:1195076-Prorocentrum_minimum.AAC.1